MTPGHSDVLLRKAAFVWVALATGLFLLVPLIAMQFTAEVNWGREDFIVMALLLFSTGSLFVLVARRSPPKRRAVIGFMFAAVFFYIWAELAVGVFTNIGN
jgi:uncharacterized membrane protein SirB2